MLQKAVKESAKYTGAEPFSSNPVIAQWRDAYKIIIYSTECSLSNVLHLLL